MAPKFRNGPPIDQGWSWMIVLAAFLHLVILTGLARSSGMFLVELIEKYHATASSASLLVTLHCAFCCFSAPLITALVQMSSCRVVGFVGSAVHASAYLISSCLNSSQEIVLCYGILTGLGYGCCLIPMPTIVNSYFDKKRSLANGLAFSGSGVGSILIPMVVYYLIDNFYLHGALFVLGAIALQTMVFASLYRPLSLYSTTTTTNAHGEAKTLLADEIDTTISPNNAEAADQIERQDSEIRTEYRTTNIRSRNVSQISNTESYYSALDLAAMQDFPSMPALNDINLQTNGDLFSHNRATVNNKQCEVDHASKSPRKSMCDYLNECYNIFWTGLQTSLSGIRRCIRTILYSKNNDGKKISRFSGVVLKNCQYLWYLTSVTLFVNLFFLSMIVPPYCADLNISKADAAMMISFYGGADFCGRLFTAAIGDRKFVKTRRRQAIFLYSIIEAILIFILTNTDDFYTLTCVLTGSGFVYGAFVSMNPVVITDIVGVQNMASAWGLLTFCQGITLTVSPLVIGALRDYTGTYISGLYYLSCSCCLASLCLLVSILLWIKK